MNQELMRPGRSIEVPGVSHGKAPIPMAARVGPLLMSSAIIGKDPQTDAFPADPLQQIPLAFSNLRTVLANGGATPAHVVHLSVHLSDNTLRDEVNKEWLKLFPDVADRPARHVLPATLQHGMVVQLEVVAYVT